MKIQVDEKKYNINKEKIDTESYLIRVETKEKQCSVCKKSFEGKRKNMLNWTDDEGFYRIGYFCKEHYSMVRKVLIEEKRKGLE